MRKLTILLALVLGACSQANQSTHPSLLLTADGVQDIRAHKGKLPVFDASLDKLIQDADEAVAREICLPTPKDGGGGYSHEMHKLNYYD
ncbi:MAG: chondroitin lyase, partial [Bacteroidales bacterium]|nr:chondroitin lyase [Bacteroidales bacterium]